MSNTPGPGDRATFPPFVTTFQDPGASLDYVDCVDCDEGVIDEYENGEWVVKVCPICNGDLVVPVSNMGRRRR